jgi:glycosyltransferase involved in cell wall biosynthesis
MKLSIVVIFFNMTREAARTLYSLSPAYQRGVAAEDYEVIAIDNGSPQPLDPAVVTSHGPNFRYHYHATDSVSPVEAMNLGAKMARGDALAVIVDGARMASPGLVRLTLDALRLDAKAFVCARAWHLGPEVQNFSMLRGYDQATEDALLAEINWREDGYRLFDVSVIAPSSRGGFLGPFPPECSWLAMSRTFFLDLGGYDIRFQSPGGGLCNHEFRNRVLASPGVRPINLLGEGVFHQVHGGVSTNVAPDNRPNPGFRAEFERLKGEPFKPAPAPGLQYVGTLPTAARSHLAA